MTGEDGGVPTVDADDVPEGAFDDIDVMPVDEMTIDQVTAPAESLVRSFNHDVTEAIGSAMWHTIIDGAGTERFVDGFDVDHLREAERALRSNGYAADGLTKTDIYIDTDEAPKGAAFFAGDAAADMFDEHVDEAVRLAEDEVDGTGDDLPGIDGYLVERASSLPSNLIVFLDVDAIARVPAEARSRPVGLDTTPTVSSPVIVRDPDGVAVVNVGRD